MKMADYIDMNNAWGEGTLQDWYMSSIDNTIPPIWTEEHISELCNDFFVIPKESPVADVAPVVHGRWKFSEKLETLDMTIYECSACGGQLLPSKAEKSEWSKNPRYAYCSYCGARMDGDKND